MYDTTWHFMDIEYQNQLALFLKPAKGFQSESLQTFKLHSEFTFSFPPLSFTDFISIFLSLSLSSFGNRQELSE